MISPEEVRDLYNSFQSASSGKAHGVIKSALVSCLLFHIQKTSTTPDEAVLQWNEISLFVEQEFRKRISPDLHLFNPIFSGDK